MPFAVDDFEDLMRLLEQRPEWQDRLRRAILADDFLALPQIVRDLAEAQRRAEERLSGVEERLAGVEERLARLEESVAKLAEAQLRAEARLTKAEELLAALVSKTGTMSGYLLELRFQHRPHAYFSRLLRRVRLVEADELDRRFASSLSEEEMDEAALADVVVRGIPAGRPELGEVFVVMEISGTIDRHDVERAVKRADLVRKAGVPVIPAAVGEDATAGALLESESHKVLLLQDGKRTGWDEALYTWVEEPRMTAGDA